MAKIGMALIALMLWQWYKSRAAGGGAERPSQCPRRAAVARIPSDEPPAQCRRTRRSQMPSAAVPAATATAISVRSSNPRRNHAGRAAAAAAAAVRWTTTRRSKAAWAAERRGGSLGDILNDILRGGAAAACRAATRSGPGGGSPRRRTRWRRRAAATAGSTIFWATFSAAAAACPVQRVTGAQSDPLSDAVCRAPASAASADCSRAALRRRCSATCSSNSISPGAGDAARSWVSTGENVPVTPKEIEKTFGSDIIDQLADQFGIDKDELLKGLSETLAAGGRSAHARRTAADRAGNFALDITPSRTIQKTESSQNKEARQEAGPSCASGATRRDAALRHGKPPQGWRSTSV